MATRPGIEVRFVGLGGGEAPPAAALYALDARGGMKKLAVVEKGRLGIDPGQLKGLSLAIGPDSDDPKSLDPESLLRYRGDQVIEDWAKRGILLPQDRWSRLIREYLCVSGRVRKCRPWWYDRFVVQAAFSPKLGATRARAPRNLALSASAVSAANVALGVGALDNVAVLQRCEPLCDGIVEVYERHCCCTRFVYDDLIDRLRDLLERIPIEVDFPWPPEPEPDPRPWERLRQPVLHNMERRAPMAAKLQQRLAGAGIRDAAGVNATTETFVSERIHDDYQALLRMSPEAAEAYVYARPYLTGYICSCTMRKVGQVAIGPGGHFDFCYARPLRYIGIQRCFTTYAYRVKQQFGPFWITVYDGVAGHDYFAAGETAELVTTSPLARPCADGPEPPDPGDGTAFVMLEHVTGAGTHHHNFPVQNGLSHVGALAVNSGLYDFAGQRDAPWAKTLGLRLWVSPTLEGTVAYYRIKVVAVDDSGTPVGSPKTLDTPVAWSRYIVVPGDIVTTSTSLAALPADVGGEVGLFAVPYWSNGMMWLSGQYHQLWDTTKHADGRYMLTIELFGPGGVRIKPGGAPASDPGTAKPFQFRVWEAPDDTANVPFADCAHVFRISNTPVSGDIVDLRKNNVPNTDECQFMSGPAGTKFSVGFRAYHVDGVTTGGGLADTNSFMADYTLTWQRGLSGPTGTIEAGTADQGELVVEPSNQLDFDYLLGAFPPTHGSHTRCSFSVHLHVDAKHHNGSSFIDAYDYHETASFALELLS